MAAASSFGVWVSLQAYRHLLNFPLFPLPYLSPGGQAENSLIFAFMSNILVMRTTATKVVQKLPKSIMIVFLSFPPEHPTSNQCVPLQPSRFSSATEWSLHGFSYIPSCCPSPHSFLEQEEKPINIHSYLS